MGYSSHLKAHRDIETKALNPRCCPLAGVCRCLQPSLVAVTVILTPSRLLRLTQAPVRNALNHSVALGDYQSSVGISYKTRTSVSWEQTYLYCPQHSSFCCLQKEGRLTQPTKWPCTQSPLETLLPVLPHISLRSPHQISFAGSTLLLALFNCLL